MIKLKKQVYVMEIRNPVGLTPKPLFVSYVVM